MSNNNVKELNAFEYLNYLQNISKLSTGVDIDYYRLNIEKEIKKMCTEIPYWKNKEQELRLSFENFKQHDGKTPFEKYVDIIMPILDDKSGDLIKSIPKGDLSLPDPNAAAIKIPSGGVLLAFNLGITDLSRSFLEIIYSSAHKLIDEKTLFMFCILNGLWNASGGRDGRLKHTIIPYSKPELYAFVQIYTMISEFFIAAHEISHVLLDHLDTSSVTKMGALPKIDEHEPLFLKKRKQQEYDADENAIKIYLKAIDKSPFFASSDFKSVPMFAGVDIFFSIVDFIEKIWGNYGVMVGTHPPAKERKNNLRNIFKKYYTSKDLEIADLFSSVLESIWKNWKDNELRLSDDRAPCTNCSWPVFKLDSYTCRDCGAYLCRACVRIHSVHIGHNRFSVWFLCQNCRAEEALYHVSLTNSWTPYTYNESYAYRVESSYLCENCSKSTKKGFIKKFFKY
jgi:hypothetical protein